jgi:hypothetical protein
MHTKLTLRIQAPLVRAAKKYSKNHGKSLSQLVSDYLYLVTGGTLPMHDMEPMPPLARSLKGILKGKKLDEADYKKHLKDKYL